MTDYDALSKINFLPEVPRLDLGDRRVALDKTAHRERE